MDSELHSAILKAVDRRFLKGRNHETRQHHHVAVLREVAELLNLPLPCEREHRLQRLLGTTFYRSELGSLLDHWVRQHSIGPEKLIKTREPFAILGVDGFDGIDDFKAYLHTDAADAHYLGVVDMYSYMDASPIACLTGTDSACVVFLALLKLFSTQIVDDHVKIVVERVRNRTENFMHRHAQYYRDICLVNEDVLNALIRVYVNANSNWCELAAEKTDTLFKNKKKCLSEEHVSFQK
ncbi:hypothetical protein AVEN_34102-1 [Araneus ventricosus]|uniref:Uncharacterized protein n=1 Tax=Araneus ventricosus TaxID=182803 RepID=A0A4Y2W5U2_ARAVE|nr:hypothetical protein AVEN_34102-1 [Araneus ventricosus]